MIGWRETASLPDWAIEGVKIKADTGARTTAVHASDIEECHKGGALWVRFALDHPAIEEGARIEAKVLHRRAVTNTGGVAEVRYIIATALRIGDRSGRVEMSLAERGSMKFPIILGRTSMRVLRLTVDPTRSWLASPKPVKAKPTS